MSFCKEQNKARDLEILSKILDALLNSHDEKTATSDMSEECQHPASVATYWISKWVDYSDKYGIG